MQTFNIKPAVTGRKVLDPVTFQALPSTGEVKPRNGYWLRRIKDGDVIEITEKKATKKPKEITAKES